MDDFLKLTVTLLLAFFAFNIFFNSVKNYRRLDNIFVGIQKKRDEEKKRLEEEEKKRLEEEEKEKAEEGKELEGGLILIACVFLLAIPLFFIFRFLGFSIFKWLITRKLLRNKAVGDANFFRSSLSEIDYSRIKFNYYKDDCKHESACREIIKFFHDFVDNDSVLGDINCKSLCDHDGRWKISFFIIFLLLIVVFPIVLSLFVSLFGVFLTFNSYKIGWNFAYRRWRSTSIIKKIINVIKREFKLDYQSVLLIVSALAFIAIVVWKSIFRIESSGCNSFSYYELNDSNSHFPFSFRYKKNGGIEKISNFSDYESFVLFNTTYSYVKEILEEKMNIDFDVFYKEQLEEDEKLIKLYKIKDKEKKSLIAKNSQTVFDDFNKKQQLIESKKNKEIANIEIRKIEDNDLPTTIDKNRELENYIIEEYKSIIGKDGEETFSIEQMFDKLIEKKNINIHEKFSYIYLRYIYFRNKAIIKFLKNKLEILKEGDLVNKEFIIPDILSEEYLKKDIDGFIKELYRNFNFEIVSIFKDYEKFLGRDFENFEKFFKERGYDKLLILSKRINRLTNQKDELSEKIIDLYAAGMNNDDIDTVEKYFGVIVSRGDGQNISSLLRNENIKKYFDLKKEIRKTKKEYQKELVNAEFINQNSSMASRTDNIPSLHADNIPENRKNISTKANQFLPKIFKYDDKGNVFFLDREKELRKSFPIDKILEEKYKSIIEGYRLDVEPSIKNLDQEEIKILLCLGRAQNQDEDYYKKLNEFNERMESIYDNFDERFIYNFKENFFISPFDTSHLPYNFYGMQALLDQMTKIFLLKKKEEEKIKFIDKKKDLHMDKSPSDFVGDAFKDVDDEEYQKYDKEIRNINDDIIFLDCELKKSFDSNCLAIENQRKEELIEEYRKRTKKEPNNDLEAFLFFEEHWKNEAEKNKNKSYYQLQRIISSSEKDAKEFLEKRKDYLDPNKYSLFQQDDRYYNSYNKISDFEKRKENIERRIKKLRKQNKYLQRIQMFDGLLNRNYRELSKISNFCGVCNIPFDEEVSIKREIKNLEKERKQLFEEIILHFETKISFINENLKIKKVYFNENKEKMISLLKELKAELNKYNKEDEKKEDEKKEEEEKKEDEKERAEKIELKEKKKEEAEEISSENLYGEIIDIFDKLIFNVKEGVKNSNSENVANQIIHQKDLFLKSYSDEYLSLVKEINRLKSEREDLLVRRIIADSQEIKEIKEDILYKCKKGSIQNDKQLGEKIVNSDGNDICHVCSLIENDLPLFTRDNMRKSYRDHYNKVIRDFDVTKSLLGLQAVKVELKNKESRCTGKEEIKKIFSRHLLRLREQKRKNSKEKDLFEKVRQVYDEEVSLDNKRDLQLLEQSFIKEEDKKLVEDYQNFSKDLKNVEEAIISAFDESMFVKKVLATLNSDLRISGKPIEYLRKKIPNEMYIFNAFKEIKMDYFEYDYKKTKAKPTRKKKVLHKVVGIDNNVIIDNVVKDAKVVKKDKSKKKDAIIINNMDDVKMMKISNDSNKNNK